VIILAWRISSLVTSFTSLYDITIPTDTILAAMGQNAKLKIIGPYFNYKERLNVQPITDTVGDAANASYAKNPSQFIIVSGDSDIYPVILITASKRSFPVFF